MMSIEKLVDIIHQSQKIWEDSELGIGLRGNLLSSKPSTDGKLSGDIEVTKIWREIICITIIVGSMESEIH